MNCALNSFLVVYIIYLPVFLFLVLLSGKQRHKKHSVFSFWISNMAERKKFGSRFFAPAFFIFGLLGLWFSYCLFHFLPAIFLSKIAVLFFILGNLLTMAVALFPVDKKPKIHEQLANCLFVCLFLFFAFLIYPLLAANFSATILLVLDFLILVFSGLLVYSFVSLRLKYQSRALNNMPKIKKIEHTLIAENATYWEWFVFILTIAWNFVGAVVFLNYLIK